MNSSSTSPRCDRDLLMEKVIAILEDMTSDWDLAYDGGIGPDTCLISDLTCESIDIVQFVVAIEECFQRRDFPFERLLMAKGRYVDDLTVNDVVNFLDANLNSHKPVVSRD
jgi:acyl carrier protein